jgi:hypothetical protein
MPALLLLPRKTKIAQLHLPVLPNKHVGTLQIPVQNLLHVVQIDHPLDNSKQNLGLFDRGKLLLFLMELVEEGPILKVLRDKGVLIGSDTHAHIKYDIGVFEVTDDLQFLHEVLLVAVLASLEVVLDGDQLPHVLPLVHLPEPALPDQLQLLYVLLPDQEVQTPVLLQEFVELTDLG